MKQKKTRLCGNKLKEKRCRIKTRWDYSYLGGMLVRSAVTKNDGASASPGNSNTTFGLLGGKESAATGFFSFLSRCHARHAKIHLTLRVTSKWVIVFTKDCWRHWRVEASLIEAKKGGSAGPVSQAQNRIYVSTRDARPWGSCAARRISAKHGRVDASTEHDRSNPPADRVGSNGFKRRFKWKEKRVRTCTHAMGVGALDVRL